MNWNNPQFDNSMPMTVRAARQVGAILKCLDRTSTTATSYADYMRALANRTQFLDLEGE